MIELDLQPPLHQPNRLACLKTSASVVLVAAMAMALSSANSITSALTADDIAQLKTGEPVVTISEAESPADGDVVGTIDIAMPAAAVWNVLIDCAGAPAFMENLKSCTVIERDPAGKWDVRAHEVQWLALLPKVRSVFRSDYVTNQSIRFKRAGGDLNYLEGQWRLEPMQGGKATRVHYQARVGFSSLVPSFMVRSALEKDIPHFLKVIRQEVMRRSVASATR